jgi:DHA1 family bicyclomycin/chloramphenicol resistance-like MFS transporter
MLINSVAPIAAPIFGAQLLRITSWTGVFLILSLIGLFLLVSIMVGLPESLPAEKRIDAGLFHSFSHFWTLLRDPVFMGYGLSQGLITAGMFAYIAGSPFVVQKVYGTSPQIFSLFFAINDLGIIIASQMTGRLAGRIAEQKMLRLAYTMPLLEAFVCYS